MKLNADFLDFLRALLAEDAEFLVVGAYAMAAHGVPRATGDLDVWIRASEENAGRVWRALLTFGAPVESAKLGVEDLQSADTVFQMGRPPSRIDLLTSVSGVAFEAAWPRRTVVEIDGIEVPCIGAADLEQNKRATGRPKDLLDAQTLRDRKSSTEREPRP